MQHVLNLYSSGSQPFPTRGPLDKFCLGSRTTKKFLHFLGKISEFMTTFLKSFPLNCFSVCGPPKRISPIFTISLHFQGSRTEKHSNFHLQYSLVVTQSMKRLQVLVHSLSSF